MASPRGTPRGGSTGRLRVIAGEYGGRRLLSPGPGLRPTSDRVKESVFAALGPGRLTGARVLDLFAGTGALAIEALSRGAASALLVERDQAAVRTIAANLEALGLTDRAEVRRGDVAAVLRAGPPGRERFDLVLADPPYDLAQDDVKSLVSALTMGDWLAPEATIVVERRKGSGPPPLPDGWVSTWERCYGDTLVWFAETIEGAE